MNTRYLTTIIVLLIFSPCAFAQQKPDTIFLFNKKILGFVKEVREHTIVYLHPNESVNYYIPKKAVNHISFATGREEQINDINEFNSVNFSEDWEKVEVTTNPYETEGLTKIADVITVKATGATVFSSVTNTQSRAFRKLRMVAAMRGGDIVLLLNQSVEGNIRVARTTRTQLTAAVFRSISLDTTGIHVALKDITLRGLVRNELKVNYKGIESVRIVDSIRINPEKIIIRKGIAYINIPELEKQSNEMVLTYWSKSIVVLSYQRKNRFYELIYKF